MACLVRHNSLHVMVFMPSAKEDLSHPIPVGQHIGLGLGRSTQPWGVLNTTLDPDSSVISWLPGFQAKSRPWA
jgi:hypothetical protein